MFKIVLTISISISLFFIGCDSKTPKKVSPFIDDYSVVYTLHGKKDKRLSAYYSATYKSTNWTKKCRSKHLGTGRDRPSLLSRVKVVQDGEYKIDFPIYILDKEDVDSCKYKFRSLNLIMRRKYDKELASIHTVLSKNNKTDITYFRTRGGSVGGGGDKEMPAYIFTDKKYFQVVNNTNFFCRTHLFEAGMIEKKEHTTFHCIMKIKDGKDKNKFYYPSKLHIATNSQFGVNEVKSTKLKINILADDNGSIATVRDRSKRYRENKNIPYNFAEYPKPDMVKFKEKWNKLFK